MDPRAQSAGRQGSVQELIFRPQFAGRPWQASMAQPCRGELPPTTSRCATTVRFRRPQGSQTHCPLLQEARARAAASQFSRFATRRTKPRFPGGDIEHRRYTKVRPMEEPFLRAPIREARALVRSTQSAHRFTKASRVVGQCGPARPSPSSFWVKSAAERSSVSFVGSCRAQTCQRMLPGFPRRFDSSLAM